MESKGVSTCQAESGLINLRVGDGGERPVPDSTATGCNSAGLVLFLNQNGAGVVERGLGLITLPEALSLISDMKTRPWLFALIK